jgi:type III restriction enzyme
VNPQVLAITSRLSLRPPQRISLEILDRVCDLLPLAKNGDLVAGLEAIRAEFPMVPGLTDFERAFPSLCFALATGVGKTRLMGAFCTYLYQARGIRNFFILAPNLTIYNKLTQDFTPGTPKYVFQGIADFVAMPPRIETGDTYQQRGGLFNDEGVEINIFNISKINSDTRGRAGATPNFKKMNEYLGQPYFDYLRSKEDLVILMDESHRYRGDAGVRAIEQLQPVLGLELTATPQTQQGIQAVPFKNIIYSYPLASALADGFVKKPAVATRENFRAENYSPEELEDVKLADGIALHENTRVELEAYAAENRVRRVKPFMLVVARQTEHANELVRKMESEAFAAGRYKGRVITIHSNLSGVEREENVQKLLEVEDADNPIEIVVHVDQLKEGWDVTNLYTIVPLRTADSRTLVEQSIGRGLRLPYGRRIGNAAVDRLTIVAHDRFQEIVDLANSGDSPLKVGFETVYVPTTKPTLVTLSPSYLEELGLATASPHAGMSPSDAAATQIIFATEPERQAARTTLDVIREFEKTTKLADLNRAEVQASIVEQVKQRLLPVQGALPGIEPLTLEQTTSVVAKLTESLQQRMIAIPRITVTPKDGAGSGFKDFDLDCSTIRQSYAAQDILTIDLTDNSASRLGASKMRSLEQQLENYVVRNLMDYDDIDYMANAELLYKLSGQLIAHLRSYLTDDDQVLSVLYANQKPFAAIIRGQMHQHFEQPETGFQVKVTRSFQMLSESFASADSGQHAVDFHQIVSDLQGIRSMVFGGFTRCCYSLQRFDSDTERRFAVILDRDSQRWLKPSARDLHIYYSHEEKYHPDFVVETESGKYICETKAANEMQDPTVLLKAKAALAWCEHASLSDDKPWTYVLIPHPAVQHAATLEGLAASYAHRS